MKKVVRITLALQALALIVSIAALTITGCGKQEKPAIPTVICKDGKCYIRN